MKKMIIIFTIMLLPTIVNASPIMENGRVLVPMRSVFESLGASMEWDGSTQTVVGTKGTTVVKLTIGKSIATVNGKQVKIDVPGKIVEGKTLVPLRFISESLGVDVTWDSENKRALINNGSDILEVSALSEKEVYASMMALKSEYPEGMGWTNDNKYRWKGGGEYTGGLGCVAFAFILSDAAFRDLPVERVLTFDNLRAGDIIRINNDTHSVVVLSVKNGVVTIAEGNYGSRIHWGREFTLEEIKSVGDYVMTRYPK